MSAYTSIFELSNYVLATLASVLLISIAVFRSSTVARSILISPGMWLAPIFYLVYLVASQKKLPEIFASLVFEVTVLYFWLLLVSRLIICTNTRGRIELPTLTKWLKIGVGIQIIIAMYLVLQDGMGLFSEGSRIEYLADSRVNLYLTYASGLTVAVQIPIAAAIISYREKWDAWALVYVVLTMVLSIISGSKGAGLLVIIALISYVRLLSFKKYLKLMVIPIIFGMAFLQMTVFYVGKFLQIEQHQMLELVYSRIFLINDGRALAIDFENQISRGNVSLFQESFRAIASALGNAPINMPLGQLLYSEAFATEGLLGANTSASALLIAYGDATEKTVFFILLLLFILAIYWVACLKGKYLIVRLGIGSLLLNLLTQDFLAFQVTTNLLLLIAFATCLFKLLIKAIRNVNLKLNKST